MSNLSSIDYLIICAYLAAVLFQGIWVGRRIQDLQEYAVAGRAYRDFIVFATLAASFIGGGFSMGNAEKVFQIGIVNIVALWGFSLKEILVATCIAPRIGQFPGVISVGDIMEKNYGRFGKVTAGVFGVILCAGILGAQVGAIGYIFNLFLHLPIGIGILVGTGIVIIYATLGGMRSVVATDITQFLVLSTGIILALLLGLQATGGLDGLMAGVPENRFNLFGTIRPWKVLSLFLTFLLGETLVPPYVQRLFIGKSAHHTARGTLWSGLFSIPFFAITGTLGLVALALKPDLNPNLALPFVIQEVLPVGLRGFLIGGLMAVVMSSADSFLNSSAIAFSNDIVQPLRRRPLSPRASLRVARLATFITGALAIVFAIKIGSILDILIYAYKFWAPIIVVPLGATLLGMKASKSSFVIGAIAGIMGGLAWNILLQAPGGFDGLVVGVLANLLAFAVTNLVQRRLRARDSDR
jgi:SSS family solute:Na+ symporter